MSAPGHVGQIKKTTEAKRKSKQRASSAGTNYLATPFDPSVSHFTNTIYGTRSVTLFAALSERNAYETKDEYESTVQFQIA
jgi:hypothetical protein